MKHEMTQWKCFVPDTLSLYNHIWSHVELFCEDGSNYHHNCHGNTTPRKASNARNNYKS